MSDENTEPPLGKLGPTVGIDPAAVQDRVAGQKQLSGAQHFSSQVSHGGLDPAYITQMELFEGFSHEEIYAKVGEMAPGVMHTYADTYKSIADSLGGGLFGSLLSIQRELSDGMDGQFADAANQASRKFFEQATDVQEVFNAVGMRIKAAAYGAEVVKKSVPPPPTQTQTPGGNPAVTTGMVDPAKVAETVVSATDPAAAAAFDTYKEEQRLVAIAAMNTAYKPSYQPAGEGVPAFVPVPVPGDQPGPGGPNGTTPNSTTPGPGTQTPSGENPGENETEAPTQETPGTEEPQTTTASTNETPTSQQPSTTTGSPAGDPQRTTPSTTTPGSPGSPGMPAGTPGAPSGAPQGQTPGKTVQGAPSGAPNSPSGSPAGSTAAGTNRAMSGMPGMMGGGAGARRGEDDDEHKVPDYLIQDREEELFGTRPQLLDGVLGGDAPAAQPADDRGERR